MLHLTGTRTINISTKLDNRKIMFSCCHFESFETVLLSGLYSCCFVNIYLNIICNLPDVVDCGNSSIIDTDELGLISSANYPNYYNSSLDCSLYIRSATDGDIVLHILFFLTEFGYDSLSVCTKLIVCF